MSLKQLRTRNNIVWQCVEMEVKHSTVTSVETFVSMEGGKGQSANGCEDVECIMDATSLFSSGLESISLPIIVVVNKLRYHLWSLHQLYYIWGRGLNFSFVIFFNGHTNRFPSRFSQHIIAGLAGWGCCGWTGFTHSMMYVLLARTPPA